MPGVGFDVVPTDCLATALAAALPGANELELAFWSRGGGMSPGTAKTMLENLPHGGRVRRAGKIEGVPLTHRVEAIDFPGGRRTAVAIAWGDVSTAFHSTGIPNITCYTAVPKGQVVALRLLDPIRGVFGWGPVHRRLARWAERHMAVPGEAAAERSRTEVWGRARDAAGDEVTGTVVVREGYRFTVEASLCCVERVLAGEVAPGAWTPGKAFGPELLLSLTTFALDLPAPAEAPSGERPALEVAGV